MIYPCNDGNDDVQLKDTDTLMDDIIEFEKSMKEEHEVQELIIHDIINDLDEIRHREINESESDNI